MNLTVRGDGGSGSRQHTVRKWNYQEEVGVGGCCGMLYRSLEYVSFCMYMVLVNLSPLDRR